MIGQTWAAEVIPATRHAREPFSGNNEPVVVEAFVRTRESGYKFSVYIFGSKMA